jgi:hypothetical protein
MLSPEEKREMLEDAGDVRRRDCFRAARTRSPGMSLDSYLSFLRAVQVIFGSFRQSRRPTPTKFNKL